MQVQLVNYENLHVNNKNSFLFNWKRTVIARINGLSSKERIVFSLLVFILVFGIVGILNSLNNSFSNQVPDYGGTIREGILGTPRFINPVLANSDIDQDLTRLTYSGLMRNSGTDANAEIIPDLAESYSVSPDGKVYTFILKKNAVFHDRTPVTADDVAFTIQSIQNTQLQSPVAGNWLGITTEVVDPQTIKITLPRPFSGFLEIATVGILPKHIWGTMTADEFFASSKNNNPIGSGPYKVDSIKRNKDGIATSYTFDSFNKFTLGKPFIDKIVIRMYPNGQELFDKYEAREFTTLASIQPYEITKQNSKFVGTTPLPRMFGLFLNSKNNALLDDAGVRSALTNGINVNEIITTVFQGNAEPITSPLPNGDQTAPTVTVATETLSAKLDSAGWKLNQETGIRSKAGKNLSFTISTADTPELKYTAQIIQQQLKSIGIATELHVYQLSDLENNVIKPRAFEILLFGQFIRNDADLYAFWHSSQKTDPGLNITGYSSKTLDTNLEKLFATNNAADRTVLLASIEKELHDAPVVWLYRPYFIYAMKKPIYGIRLDNLISKHDRFNTIYRWYTQTDMVWKVFKK